MNAPPSQTDQRADVRASRMRVARSRGATSGVLLVIFGAWAALVPFIGPYFDFGFLPRPDEAWHWTTGRGLYEVLPGAAAAVGGLFLLVSANRVTTSFGGWLAAASGAWLVVGPVVAGSVGVDLSGPDPSMSQSVAELATLLYFFGIGAAIVLVAALALGRLSVHSVRDVRVAHRRAEAESAAAAEQERSERERSERERAERERAERERAERERADQQQTAVPERSAAPDRLRDDETAQATRHDAGHAPQHQATSSAQQPPAQQPPAQQPPAQQPPAQQPPMQQQQPPARPPDAPRS